MNITTTIALFILSINTCLSQSENQYGCTLKSENFEWVKSLNTLKEKDKKVQLVKQKLISDSIECPSSINKSIRIKVKANESIDQSLKTAYENTDYYCDMLFILTIKKKYAVPLSSDNKEVLELIQSQDIDSITTLTDYELTHIYGTRYCGVVFIHSVNRKLKRKVKNVLQQRV